MLAAGYGVGCTMHDQHHAKERVADAGVGVSCVQSHLTGHLGFPSSPALCKGGYAGVIRWP